MTTRQINDRGERESRRRHYGAPVTSPTSPAAPRRRLLAIGIGAVVLVALTVLGTLALTQDEDPITAAAATTASTAVVAPEAFGVRGTVTLADGFEWTAEGGPRCYGTGGFDDLTAGGAVVITDSTGATVAIGKLGQGLPKLRADDRTRAESCTFTLDVAGVPAGKGFYGLAVGHRNAVQFDEARLRSETVELTL